MYKHNWLLIHNPWVGLAHSVMNMLGNWCNFTKTNNTSILHEIQTSAALLCGSSPTFFGLFLWFWTPDQERPPEWTHCATACWDVQQLSQLCQAALLLIYRRQRRSPPVCSAGWEVKPTAGCVDLISSILGVGSDTHTHTRTCRPVCACCDCLLW